MQIIANISLRWRLLCCGLLCAILVGLAGGAGIVSLGLIQRNIEQTTEEINANIATQNTQVCELIDLRSQAAHIGNATRVQDLQNLEQDLLKRAGEKTSIQKADDPIATPLQELLEQKRNQLEALLELDTLRQENHRALDDITGLVAYICDDIEFEATLQTDEGMNRNQEHFDRMTRQNDEAIGSIKSSMSLHSHCYMLNSKLKDVLLADDPAAISYARDEISTLLTNMFREQEALGKSDRTPDHAPAMQDLADLVDQIVTTRKDLACDCSEHTPILADKLQSYKGRCDAILSELTSMALNTLDDTEFNAVMAIDASTTDLRSNFNSLVTLVDNEFQQVKAVMKVRAGCIQLHSLVQATLVQDDPALVDYRWTEVQTLLTNTHNQLKALEQNTNTEKISRLLTLLEKGAARMFEAHKRLIAANHAFTAASSEIDRQMTRVDQTTLKIAGQVRADAEKAMFSSNETVHRWQQVEILLVVIASILALSVGIIIARTVSRQLQTLNQGIRVIGEGNLEHKVDTGTDDEIGQLSRAFDGMTEKLSRREAAVRNSEHRFRRLFEQSNDGIIIHDLSANILDVNERMVEMTGFDLEQLRVMTVPDLHEEEDRGFFMAALDDLKAGKRVQVESVYRKEDGGSINVDSNSSLIDPRENLVQTVVQDITQRKKAMLDLETHMQEVSDANRRLEILVANTTDREQRMVQLKEEVNTLLTASGKKARYEAPAQVAELLAGSTGNHEGSNDE